MTVREDGNAIIGNTITDLNMVGMAIKWWVTPPAGRAAGSTPVPFTFL